MLIGPMDGERVDLGGFGARYMAEGEGFALVEHPIAPRTLAAPMHTHTHEDEFSYVVEGEVGFQVGDEIVYARPGDLVRKPRGVAHAFWNRTDEPARVLEVISPAGFERYFADIAALLPPAVPVPDFEGLAAVQRRYGLDMDRSSIESISRREGLPLPPGP